MKKIISIIVMTCMMIMSVFTFSGCNLMHDNNKRVNAEIVGKVGDETITRNDVITWFNYYYYSSGLYYQYSEEEVYEITLNNLVKFKLIINEAKHTDEIVLSISDQNHIWEQVFDYLDQTIDGYEDEIRERFGAEKAEREDEEEEESEPVKFVDEYKRKEVTYSIDYEQNDTVLQNEYKVPTAEENYYRYLAYQKYLKEITKSANIYSSKEISSEDAWDEEINRYYKYYEDRLYVQKYNDYCLKNLKVTPDAIVSAYVEDLNAQIQKFGIYDSFLSTLTSSSNEDLVVYYEEGDTFAVQQIVLGFDDMISATFNGSTTNVSEYLSKYLNSGFVFDAKDAKTDEQKEYIDIRYDYAINHEGSLDMGYIDPTTGLTTDEEGNTIEKTYADFKVELKGIEDAYKNKLDELKLDGSLSEEEKDAQIAEAERKFVQAFYKLKFSYSKDGGVTDLDKLFNKVGYIFPKHEEDMTTSWVSEFTEAAYKLYDNYVENGTYGVETFVSNYGVHVMIFAGTMNYGPIADKTYESLNSTYFSMSTNQTVADYYHDKLLTEMQSAGTSNYYLQAMIGSSISSVVYEKVGSILYNEYSVAGKIEIKYPEYEDLT